MYPLPSLYLELYACSVVCQILEPCIQLSSHNISAIGIFPRETAQPVASKTRNTTDVLNPTEWSQGSKLLDSALLARQTMYVLYSKLPCFPHNPVSSSEDDDGDNSSDNSGTPRKPYDQQTCETTPRLSAPSPYKGK